MERVLVQWTVDMRLVGVGYEVNYACTRPCEKVSWQDYTVSVHG